MLLGVVSTNCVFRESLRSVLDGSPSTEEGVDKIGGVPWDCDCVDGIWEVTGLSCPADGSGVADSLKEESRVRSLPFGIGLNTVLPFSTASHGVSEKEMGPVMSTHEHE